MKGNEFIGKFRNRSLYTDRVSHLTYKLSFTCPMGVVLSQVRANANVLTIHTNLSQRLSAEFVAVTGHDSAIGSSLIADLIHPVTRNLA